MIINWNVLTAIGTCAGAVATLAAVLVALYQSKWANRKKLRLSFGDSYNSIDQIYGVQGPYICMTIRNVGNRRVIIDSWGIKFSKNDWLFFRGNVLNPADPDFNQLPKDVQIEERVCLLLKRKPFTEAIQQKYESGRIRLYSRIKLYVADSSGKLYYLTTKYRVKHYLKSSGEK